MAKLNDLTQLLKQAEAKVESLKTEMRAMEYDPTWKPVVGDEYYFLTTGGSIGRSIVSDLQSNQYTIDTHRLRCNNVFKTEKEAELYLKIFNRIHELNEQDPVDWGSEEDKSNFYCGDLYSRGLQHSQNIWCKNQGVTYMTEATKNKIQSEFTDKELEVWVRR